MQLRPHQSSDLESLRSLYRAAHRSVVYVAPTGSGKTTTASQLMRLSVAKGRRVIFMAHLRTLIGQCSDRLKGLGIEHGVIMAGHPRSDAPVQVCSRDTLLARRGDHPAADLIILDECHHVIGAKYEEILGWYPKAHLLGLTATPIREDGRGLGNAFQAMHCSLTPRQLTDQGYLVPARVYAPDAPDLRSVATQGGEFKKSQLAEVSMKIVGDMPQNWLKFAPFKRSVYFGVNLEHSKAIVESFNAKGIPAAHLDASSSDDERRETLARLERREIWIVSNVGLFTEGADFPWVECVGLGAATHSLGKYIQMVGRGARSFDGKDDFIVMDHADCTRMHGFLVTEREWSLQGAEKKARKGEIDESPSVKMCPECYRAYESTEPACPGCGKKTAPKIRSIESKKGTLKELKEGDETVGTKGLSANPKVRKLQKIAREFGYQRGWLWHQLQAIASGKEPKIPSKALHIWEDRAA